MPDAFTVMINGGYGVGKSAALDHVGDRLAAAGRPFSLMDVDWFHRSWPPAPDDPANVITEAANLSAVWSHYRRQGPRQLVVSGVLADPDDVGRYTEAFGQPVRSVRLTARATTTESRLRRRYSADQQVALDWHLERYAALADRLASADLDELVISTDDLSPGAVARRICTHFALDRPLQE